jgi:hypothetical protein
LRLAMRITAAVALGAIASLVASCDSAGDPHRGWRDGPDIEGAIGKVTLEPRPEFTEGEFPCSDCHYPDLPSNKKRRKLKLAHEDLELNHGGGRLWCLDCHDAQDRDQLHLSGGTLIPFEDTRRLCAQCHGEEFRDWKAGAHGVRTGSWRGDKLARRCAQCHDAHAPKFKPLAPMPAPKRPRRTR